MSNEEERILDPPKVCELLEENTTTDSPENRMKIRIYKLRWFVSAVVSLLVFSNSMSRIAFGPVAYTSATFYESEIGVINWFAIVYMTLGIPCGLVVAGIMGKIGLRHSLLFASWLHCLGCVLRVLSAIASISTTGKLILVFAGHILSAISQPFFMFAPTKVAAMWFPDNQRAIANTIMVMGNPLGVMAANIFSPLLVKKPDDILLMLILYAIPSVVGAFLATFGIRASSPPIPPSFSATKHPDPFQIGVKHLMRNGQYWIIAYTIGGGYGIFTALTVFLEQILCPWGYTDFFAGVVCGSCLLIAGVTGATIAGIVADKTKRFALVTKSSYVGCIAGLLLFTIFQNKQNQQALVALGCALAGFFGLPLLPLANEMVVETTYPVEPTTSAGLLILSGQLQGILLVLGLQAVATPIAPEYNNVTRCNVEEEVTSSGVSNQPIQIKDMSIPCYVMLGYGAFVCLIFVLFYRSANRRIKMETEGAKGTLTNGGNDLQAEDTQKLHNSEN